MKRLLGVAGAAVLLCLLAPAARAQTGIAQGKVVDQSGQPIADAQVEISFQGGINLKRSCKTSKKGEYTQVGLQPGVYRFTASKEGYQPFYVEMKVGLGDPTQIPEIKLHPKGAGGAGAGAAAGGSGGGKAPDLGPAAQAAVDLVKAGKYDEAETAFQDLIAKAAPNSQLHLNLGYIYVQKKDYAKAEAEYQKAIELDPNSTDGYIQLARVYKDGGNADKALEFITKAAADHPKDGRLAFTQGLYLLNAMKSDEAGVAFQKAAELDPQNSETSYYLGTLALQQNKTADAIAFFEKYLAGTPASPENAATAKALLDALKKKK